VFSRRLPFIDGINKIMALYNYTLPELIDYEVRIPKGDDTYTLTECLITWECAEDIRKRAALMPIKSLLLP